MYRSKQLKLNPHLVHIIMDDSFLYNICTNIAYKTYTIHINTSHLKQVIPDERKQEISF